MVAAQEIDKLRSAMQAICPDDYQTWIKVGIIWKSEGGRFEDWERWSSDSPKYHPGECEQKWSTFASGKAKAGAIYKMARDCGWSWDDRRGRAKRTPASTALAPKRLDLPPDKELELCIRTLFKPDDFVCIVTSARKDADGKWKPGNGGFCRKASDLLERLEKGGINAAIGSYNHEAGAWFCPNPTNGKGHNDADVVDFRYTLIESDEIPRDAQERAMRGMNLPIATMTDSGGKSVHAIVSVGAEGAEHFRERIVDVLHPACSAAGLPPDEKCKNPGRLTRLPGVDRGKERQRLIATSIGARSFVAWKAALPRKNEDAPLLVDALPSIRHLDLSNIPDMKPELVQGVLRLGHKMTITGKSKSGKSFSAIQLATAVATGEKWMGFRCRQGRVLYVDFELDPASFWHRFSAVVDRRGLDRGVVSNNIDVWNLRGYSEPLETLAPTIVDSARSGDYSLVVLDPIYKVVLGDENSAETISKFCRAVDELTKLGASVLCIHHHSKGYQGDKASQDRGSGSGVFARDADALIDFTELYIPEAIRESAGLKPKERGVQLSFDLREFENPNPINVFWSFPIHVRDYEGKLDGCEPWTPAQRGGHTTAQIHEMANVGKVAKVEQIVDKWRSEHDNAPMPIKELADAYGAHQRTVKKHLELSKRYSRAHPSPTTCVVVALDEVEHVEGS